nr:PREDICTED: SH2 domain-containing adapter protein F isoform X7 [Rhinolophus sinicus]
MTRGPLRSMTNPGSGRRSGFPKPLPLTLRSSKTYLGLHLWDSWTAAPPCLTGIGTSPVQPHPSPSPAWRTAAVGPVEASGQAQFEGSEKSCLSPGREEKGRLPPRLPAGNPKSAKPLTVEPSSPLGEWTDPALPLENQVWYHGAISRTDAENLLRLCKEASYLVRNSETSKNDFSLSLKSSQGFMHMKLSRTKEHKYVLGQNSPPFSSVPEIVHHYASRKLPIKGAEHMSLLYPVAIRTL